MENKSFNELQKMTTQQVELPKKLYLGPTTYMGKKVGMNHTPKYYIKTMLSILQKTHFVGMAVIAPPGHGKTTMVQTLVHHLHQYKPLESKDPPKMDFNIVWAGADEFKDQGAFYQSLPKKNTVIVFDDVSGAIQQLGEKKANAAFEAMTKILHTIGKVNHVIVICMFHYSKNMPKDFRAQFGYKVWLAMGDEEQTNIKSMFDKGSASYSRILKFGKLYQNMMEWNNFSLRISTNQRENYKTDRPFRCAAVATPNWTGILLYARENCFTCSPPNKQKELDAQHFFDKFYHAYGNNAIKAMVFKLREFGRFGAMHKEVANALNFWDKVVAHYHIDYDDLEHIILKKTKKKKTTRLRAKKKEEEAAVEQFSRSLGQPLDSDTVQRIVDGMNGQADPFFPRRTGCQFLICRFPINIDIHDCDHYNQNKECLFDSSHHDPSPFCDKRFD